MRVLLDSHTLIWAVDNPGKLSVLAAATLQDPAIELVVSTATVWEMAIKVGLGKLTLSIPFRDWMTQAIGGLETSLLQITVDHADAQAGLPLHHRDPFDRLMIAQAIVENMQIVSVDPNFDLYPIQRLW